MTQLANQSNPITVLSYNISYEAMTNNSNGSAGLLGRKCKCIGNSKLTICAQNMANMVEGIPKSLNVSALDFVGFQEASRWSLLQNAAKYTLAKMGTVSTRSGKSKMVSFYNDKRYTLTKNFNGEFETDRPFQILVLKDNFFHKNGVIFINTHNPHGFTFKLVKYHLSKVVSTYLTNNEKKYRIIAVGDFNETGWDWIGNKLDDKSWEPFDKTIVSNSVSIQNVIYSCCQANGEWSDGNGGVKKGNRGGDYIFDSQGSAKIAIPLSYNVNELQSDHLPIVSVL